MEQIYDLKNIHTYNRLKAALRCPGGTQFLSYWSIIGHTLVRMNKTTFVCLPDLNKSIDIRNT